MLYFDCLLAVIITVAEVRSMIVTKYFSNDTDYLKKAHGTHNSVYRKIFLKL